MLRFKRRGSRGDARSTLAADSDAIGRSLDRHGGEEQELDLEDAVIELFGDPPTADILALRARGIDGAAFFDAELRPNWDERSQAERSAKIEAFVRLANVLGPDDPADIGPLVRTKVLVLAWAYDRLYGQALSSQLARKPHSFGRLELA